MWQSPPLRNTSIVGRHEISPEGSRRLYGLRIIPPYESLTRDFRLLLQPLCYSSHHFGDVEGLHSLSDHAGVILDVGVAGISAMEGRLGVVLHGELSLTCDADAIEQRDEVEGRIEARGDARNGFRSARSADSR